MGVADETYSEPGWEIISPAFRSHPEAWRYARNVHRQGRYKAPAIKDGTKDCGAPRKPRCQRLHWHR